MKNLKNKVKWIRQKRNKVLEIEQKILHHIKELYTEIGELRYLETESEKTNILLSDLDVLKSKQNRVKRVLIRLDIKEKLTFEKIGRECETRYVEYADRPMIKTKFTHYVDEKKLHFVGSIFSDGSCYNFVSMIQGLLNTKKRGNKKLKWWWELYGNDKIKKHFVIFPIETCEADSMMKFVVSEYNKRVLTGMKVHESSLKMEEIEPLRIII